MGKVGGIVAEDIKSKSSGWLAIVLTFTMGFVLLMAIAIVIHGFRSGWLLPYWENMTDAQGSVIALSLIHI